MTPLVTLRRPALCLACALLASGCVVRYAHHDFEGTRYDDRIERGWSSPLEVGLMTNNIPFGPSGIALSLDRETIRFDPSVAPTNRPWDEVWMKSISVGARLFPLDGGPLRLYGGGGYTRTTFGGEWTGATFEPMPGMACVENCEDTFSETFFTGYSPYWVGGVEIRGSGTTSFLFEYRHEHDRGDEVYRIGGFRIAGGIRLMVGS